MTKTALVLVAVLAVAAVTADAWSLRDLGRQTSSESYGNPGSTSGSSSGSYGNPGSTSGSSSGSYGNTGSTSGSYGNTGSSTTSYTGSSGYGYNAGCFPGTSTVQLEDGTTKVMSKLAVGDRVLTTDGAYSDVYLFTHRMSEDAVKAKFVVLTTEDGSKISLTGNHYLYVNGKLATASTAKVGDELILSNGNSSAVVAVEEVWNAGLYAPKTLTGELVVDNVLASSYTDFLPPSVTHSLLAPVRMLYSMAPKVVENTYLSGAPTWMQGML